MAAKFLFHLLCDFAVFRPSRPVFPAGGSCGRPRVSPGQGRVPDQTRGVPVDGSGTEQVPRLPASLEGTPVVGKGPRMGHGVSSWAPASTTRPGRGDGALVTDQGRDSGPVLSPTSPSFLYWPSNTGVGFQWGVPTAYVLHELFAQKTEGVRLKASRPPVLSTPRRRQQRVHRRVLWYR